MSTKTDSNFKHVRREYHILCAAKTLPNEPHLSVKSLHAVLATLYILGILVVNELSMTYVTIKRARSKVDEFVGLKRREGFVTLRAYITFVIQLLSGVW